MTAHERRGAKVTLRKTHAHGPVEGAVKLQSSPFKRSAKGPPISLPVLQGSGPDEGVGVDVVLEGVPYRSRYHGILTHRFGRRFFSEALAVSV